MAEDKLFYVGQKAFIEKEGKVLVLVDIHGPDFPGGKVQEGETDSGSALIREVREETGLEIAVESPFITWIMPLKADHKHAGKDIYLVGFRCRYLSGEVKISVNNNHKEYRWVTREDYQTFDDSSGHFKALEKYFDPAQE